MGGILGGSLPPIIATWLNSEFGSFAIGVYVSVVAVISLSCTLAVRETRYTDLNADVLT